MLALARRRSPLTTLSTLLVAAAGAPACSPEPGSELPARAAGLLVVEVDPTTPATVQLAVQACAGLENRTAGGSVYVETEPNDAEWLEDLGLAADARQDADTFVRSCVRRFPRCVRYSYARQQRLLPSVLTAGAALSAVPLDEDLPYACLRVAFDAREELATADTPELATALVAARFRADTSGLAMLNPGYDLASTDMSNPAITRDMPATMVDFAFSQRLFTVFLVNGCSNSNPESAVLSDVVNGGGWPTPLGVYGYNNSWLLGGYLHEAQTRCLPSRNMGAIPTETGNLSFFSTRRAPIEEPTGSGPPAGPRYDPTRTYVAFVVGDGDNVRFLMTTRRAWLKERLADCAAPDGSCAPLTWSLSPHAPRLAPDVFEWYLESARATGRDSFILPPSGYLYAYPSSLNPADQARFVTATEGAARLLGTRTTVHWEVNGTWDGAVESFLPRYARADGVIQGIVPVNVPYALPAFPDWGPEEFYRLIRGADGTPLVLFRPRQWRGVDDSGAGFFPSPATMASELQGYPPGTVSVIYMTSDGGLSLSNSFMPLVKLLPPSVVLVSSDDAARLAVEASGG